MNNKQFAYQLGGAISDKNGTMGTTLFFGLLTAVYAATGRWSQAFVVSMVTVYFAKVGVEYRNCENMLRTEQNEILSHPEKYPIEHAEEVIIFDETGLEHLLKRKRDGEKIEWGTVLKTDYKENRVRVYNILDSFEAEEMGFIKTRKRWCLEIDEKMAIEEGYVGCHHYHPRPRLFPGWLNAMHYSVSGTDRFFGNVNWMNLLTFNVGGKPEIIAFNRNHTYIPLTADKTRLIIADHKKIMDFLG